MHFWEMKDIIKALQTGQVVSLPTDTVYGLFLLKPEDSYKIYQLKHRSPHKPLGIYESIDSNLYRRYYKIFGDLEGMTIIEGGKGYRFCSILQPIIDLVGPLLGTSANEAGYTPITNPNHCRFSPVWNRGICELGLESTVFSMDEQKVFRYGYKYIDDLPINSSWVYKVYNPLVAVNTLATPYNFWNLINSGYIPKILGDSYINRLMSSYRFIM